MRNMNHVRFMAWLKKHGACESGIAWVHAGKLSARKTWERLENPSWLLWFADKIPDVTQQQIVLAACACAETALRYVPEGELRPAQAIETARRWARGEATIEEAWAAEAAAWAAARAAARAAAEAWAAAGAEANKIMCDLIRKKIFPFEKKGGTN